MAVGADRRRRHSFDVRASVGRVEVDDVAKQDPATVELFPPDDDSLERERARAESRDHGLAAGFETLRDSDLAFARKQLPRTNFAEIHTQRVVGALGGLSGLDRSRMLLDFDQLVFVFGLV